MIYTGAIEWDIAVYETGQLNFQSDCVNLFTRLNAEGIEVDIVIYINDDINEIIREKTFYKLLNIKKFDLGIY